VGALPVFICSVLLCVFMGLTNVAIYSGQSLMDFLGTASGAGTNASDDGSQAQPDVAPTLADGSTLIGEYRAVSQNTDEARTGNVKIAADALNGKTIAPGGTLSFCDAVPGPATNESYKEAPVVAEEGLRNERGGGINQVSSALYVAALRAGLTIEERHAHNVLVDYVPLGLDAAVNYSDQDLRITNPYDAAIKISATAEGEQVLIQITGNPLEDGLVYEPTSVITDYVIDANVIVNSDAGGEAHAAHYVVDSYLLSYHDGVNADKVLLATDTYAVSGGVTINLMGGTSDSAKPTK
jgi:vancomycin resistance protein YoaR